MHFKPSDDKQECVPLPVHALKVAVPIMTFRIIGYYMFWERPCTYIYKNVMFCFSLRKDLNGIPVQQCDVVFTASVRSLMEMLHVFVTKVAQESTNRNVVQTASLILIPVS